ncbi:MAG: ABC transporter substrate-binding protein [Gammaproteobacteria bacterium]|nr:ABC transporter substrate-binding protein [Gammaproteobacteria bacterium]
MQSLFLYLPRLILICTVFINLIDVAHAHEAIHARDASGTSITLAQPAKRIISLAPHITELLFAVGAGPQVIAVSQYSDYPTPAKALPRIGAAGALDLEKIIQLKPDLIIGWQSGNAANAIEKLRALSINVYLSEPRNLDDIGKELLDIGRLSGGAQANQATIAWQDFVRTLKPRNKKIINTFIEIWPAPLMSINQQHLLTDALQRCGGHNIIDTPALAPVVDIESVLIKKPALVVLALPTEQAHAAERDWQQWPTLHARIMTINPDELLRPTPRMMFGIRRLCAALHALAAP